MNTVAIIPARGGSRGIPRKNIAPLGGRPLIAWSIEAAREHPDIDRVVVSTDDAEIAEIAKQWGAEVPFLRPPGLSGDRCSPQGAMKHALRELARRGPLDAHVLLYPTFPFRSYALMEACIRPVLSGKVEVTWTGSCVDLEKDIPVRILDGKMQSYPKPECSSRLWETLGSIQVCRNPLTRWPTPTRFIPLDNPVERIDIDHPEDLQLAGRVLDLGLWDSRSADGRAA